MNNVIVIMAERLAAERWRILQNAIFKAKGSSSLGSTVRVVNTASVRSFSSFNLFSVSPVSNSSNTIEIDDEHCCESSRTCINEKSKCDSIKDFPKDQWILYSIYCPGCKGCEHRSTQLNLQQDSRTLLLQDDSSLSTAVSCCKSTQAVIKYVSKFTTCSLEAMIGFNNTGNVCVWPSEEVLAYYCVKHCELFKGTAVCELGCGMTGLSGIMLANTRMPLKVMLTDGNTISVENVKTNILANRDNFQEVEVFAEVLLWETFTKHISLHDSKFDYVICADCLFFENVHSELVQVISKLLKPNGCAIMFAPKRGGTLDKFCLVAEKYFKIEQTVNYDSVMWEKHLQAEKNESNNYRPDLHYPLMILLQMRL